MSHLFRDSRDQLNIYELEVQRQGPGGKCKFWSIGTRVIFKATSLDRHSTLAQTEGFALKLHSIMSAWVFFFYFQRASSCGGLNYVSDSTHNDLFKKS